MRIWKASVEAVEEMPALASLDIYSWLGRNTPTRLRKTKEGTGAPSPKSLTESITPHKKLTDTSLHHGSTSFCGKWRKSWFSLH